MKASKMAQAQDSEADDPIVEVEVERNSGKSKVWTYFKRKTDQGTTVTN